MKYRQLHPKKKTNLLNLSEEDRLNYFIRDVADFEEIWTIVNASGDYILIDDSTGSTLFLVWTHYDLAETCMFEEQRNQGGLPKKISVYYFIDKLAIQLQENSIDVGVFFDTLRKGISLPAIKLSELIDEEIDNIS